MFNCFLHASFTENYPGQWLQAVVTKFAGKVKFQSRQWRDVRKAGQLLVSRLAIKIKNKK